MAPSYHGIKEARQIFLQVIEGPITSSCSHSPDSPAELGSQPENKVQHNHSQTTQRAGPGRNRLIMLRLCDLQVVIRAKAAQLAANRTAIGAALFIVDVRLRLAALGALFVIT